MTEVFFSDEMSRAGRGSAMPERLLLWIPVGTALAYPWALRLFHDAVLATSGALAPALCLFLAFALPLSCLLFAMLCAKFAGEALPTARRVAFAALAAPPLFVLTGVLSGLLHSPVGDKWTWTVLWLALGVGVTLKRSKRPSAAVDIRTGRLRVVHGVSALAIIIFVAFHLTNHLTGLLGPATHARVMAMGRLVYRSRYIEPALVAILLFQLASGVKLAWRWSARPLGAASVMQVGSGGYLAAFILTHLNSAFVSARWIHKLQTNWDWATGAPDGLLMDAWNIRLVPHYALGVFFVLAHLFCGLRTVLLAHGTRQSTADHVWAFGLACAASASALITAALCGLRI